MESITQRRSAGAAARPSPEPSGAPPLDPIGSAGAPGKPLHVDSTPIRGQFPYGDMFLLSLLPPGLVLLAFGGRPMLIALCFGSMLTYIFDIFGAMEATVLSIVVTLMCLWGTLIYAARLLLQDSLLNFGILVILTVLICLIFFALAGQFRALRLEFETSFYFLETILMATIPLISSTILTWFIAVEFPSVDLSFAFSICHFLYCQLLLHPRPASHPATSKTSKITHWGGGPYVLSIPMVIAVYFTPIILCPALHVTMHHSLAMSSSLHRLFHFGLSCLFPILTVILSAERQLLYWPEAERPIVASLLFLIKILTTIGIALCLQTNEMLEDVKDFSGIQEPYASLVFLLIVLLLLGALVLHWLIPPQGDLSSRSSQNLLISGLLDACIGAAVILTAGLLGILDPRRSDAIIIVLAILLGSGCLTEIYRGEVLHVPTKMTVLKNVVCVTLASGMVAAGLHLFTWQHLQYLDLIITWQGVDWGIGKLCFISSFFAALAVIAPILLRRPTTRESSSLGFVPGLSQGPSVLHLVGASVGSTILVILCAGTAGFEMLLRDQDWSGLISSTDYSSSSASVVYPPFLFVTTSLLLSLTATHLFSIGVLGNSTLAAVLIIQGCKLLHLFGIDSNICASMAFLLTSLSFPFLVHLSSGWVSNKENLVTHQESLGALIWSPRLSVLEYIYYPFGAAGACYAASFTILPLALTTLGDHRVTQTQCYFAASAIWFYFVATFALVYWRSAALLRSVLFLLGGFCTLVATNSLGQFSFRYDPTYPIPIMLEVHPDLNPSSVSHLDFLLSFILAFSAFAGLMPIRSLVPRLLFVVLFTYFSSKALEQIAYPTLTQGVVTLDGGIFGFPWISCLTLCFFGTSTVLHVSSPGTSGQWIIAILTASPMFFLIWMVIEESDQLFTPLCFSASLTHISVALCSRIIEFARQHDPVYLSHSTPAASIPFAESVCILSATFGFVFGLISCWLNRHAVFFDFAIPVLALVFCTTGDGRLLHSTPAFGISASISALWWVISALYSLLLKGHDGLQFLQHFQSSSSSFLFEDLAISIWNENDEIVFRWMTLLHLCLLLFALPGVILPFLRRQNESDDLMFVLGIVGALVAIVSQVWSIRLLGVVSALYSAWRCLDIGRNVRKSEQTI